MYAKEICPEIERHISTQANNTNYETYRFWYNLGAKRVVSARELSLEEIREIRAHIPEDMEIETFIHGACAFPIPEDVFSVTLWQEEMPIREPVPIPADGNILLWRRSVRENTCRYLK